MRPFQRPTRPRPAAILLGLFALATWNLTAGPLPAQTPAPGTHPPAPQTPPATHPPTAGPGNQPAGHPTGPAPQTQPRVRATTPSLSYAPKRSAQTAMPYGSAGAYGMSPGSMQMYGGQGYGGGAPASGAGAYAPTRPMYQAPVTVASLLSAAGVPNDNGRLRWPFGLRLAGAPEITQLRDQIEGLFRYAAFQAALGPVSPNLEDELARALKELHTVLRQDHDQGKGMTYVQYDEAVIFLNELDSARRVLAAGFGRYPGASAPTSKSVSSVPSTRP